MDPYLNRFTQPDSIVPLASQGTQAWDRYAFVNNNPVRYNDPTGHYIAGNCDPMRNPNCDVPKADTSNTQGQDEGSDPRCPSDVEECIIYAYGDATQKDLLGIQDYISKITEELELAIVALALVAVLNPWALAVITELGVEIAELGRLSTFISKADSIRSSSPGEVLPMSVYGTVTHMGSKTDYGDPTLYFHGTYSDGTEAEDNFQPTTPIVEAIIEALHGRECNGIQNCN